MNALDKILSQALNPTPQWQLDQRKREASSRGKCKRLAARYGLTITHDRSLRLNIVEAGPDILQKTGWVTAELFDELWPDDRMLDDWGYMLRLLEEFQLEVNRGPNPFEDQS